MSTVENVQTSKKGQHVTWRWNIYNPNLWM